jgi:hypothetical protein
MSLLAVKFRERRNAPVECLECHARIQADGQLTPVANQAAWAAVRAQHEENCAWILTREARAAKPST